MLIHDQDLAWLQQAEGEWSPVVPANSPGVLDPLDLPGSPPPRDSLSSLLTTARLCRVSFTNPRVSLGLLSSQWSWQK